MVRIELTHRNKVLQIPEEVSEMTPQQFIHFIELVILYLNGKITVNELKTRLIVRLLGIKHRTADLFMPAKERDAAFAEIYRLSSICDSFFEDVEIDGKISKSFKLSFIRNFIPVIQGGLHGPKDALQDVTFCEYRMAHGHYLEFIRTKSEDELNRMIAVLYRPAKSFIGLRKFSKSFDGNIRIPITSKSNPVILEKRARKIARIPFHIRYAIFLYFAGCVKFLSEGTIMLDGREIDLSIIYQKSSDQTESQDIGLIGILYSLAESKVFGTIQETDGQNIYDIMIRLYQLARQSQALENNIKNHGTD